MLLGSLQDFHENLIKLSNGYYRSGDPKRIKLSNDRKKLFIQGMIQDKVVNADSPDAFYVVKEEDAEGAPMGVESSDEVSSPFYLGGGNMNSDQLIGKGDRGATKAAQYIVNNFYKHIKDKIDKATEMTKKGTDPNRPR